MSDLDIPDAQRLVAYLHDVLLEKGEVVISGPEGGAILRHHDLYFEIGSGHRQVAGPFDSLSSLFARRAPVHRMNGDGSLLAEWQSLWIGLEADGSMIGQPEHVGDWLDTHAEPVYSDVAYVDGPAGSGGFYVSRWREWYFCQDDFDGRDLRDSFRTFDEAIVHMWGGLRYGAESRVTCSELTYEDFTARFELMEGEELDPEAATPSFNGRRLQ